MGRISARMLSGIGGNTGSRGVKVYIGRGGKSNAADALTAMMGEYGVQSVSTGWEKAAVSRWKWGGALVTAP